METRANFAVIGIFTIAVIAAAFGFVYWFAGTESGVDRPMYRVEFAGSVAGLSKGSPVLFNGIRVGDVAVVEFDEKAPDQAFANIQIAKNTPVRADTKASLAVNLLSGVAQIALTGGLRDAPKLEKRDPADPYPTIVADTGGLGSIIETARGTAEKANVLLDIVTEIVRGNKGNIDTSVANLKTFTDALASNSGKIDAFLGSVAQAADRIGPVAAKLEILTDSATSLIQSVEPDRVRSIVRNVENVTQTVENGRESIANLFRDASSLAGRLNDAAPKLDQALTDAGRVIAALDPVKVNQAIDNAGRFLAGLDASTGDLQATLKNSSSLTARLDTLVGESSGELQSTLRNANALTAKLDAALADAAKIVAAIDPVKLNRTIDDAGRFVAGLGASTGDLQATLRNSTSLTARLDALIVGSSSDLQSTLKNSNSLTAKLDAAAGRVDGVLKAAEGFLGSAAGQEGKSSFESFRTAMDAFRKASENLDRRATEIASGVTRFTSTGARQVDALGGDARRAVNTVGRAAKTLERNPSSVIFGSGRASIPEYSGQ